MAFLLRMYCAPVATGSVTATAAGWQIAIAPGGHPFAPDGRIEVVPWGDRRIRDSGDEHFHVCLSPNGRLLCVYVPAMGS